MKDLERDWCEEKYCQGKLKLKNNFNQTMMIQTSMTVFTQLKSKMIYSKVNMISSNYKIFAMKVMIMILKKKKGKLNRNVRKIKKSLKTLLFSIKKSLMTKNNKKLKRRRVQIYKRLIKKRLKQMKARKNVLLLKFQGIMKQMLAYLLQIKINDFLVDLVFY